MGEKNTEFCGRILIFLSQAFPLGERSGVNLRGEYGPPWDGPVAKPVKPKGQKAGEDKDKMAVDESPEALEEAKKEGTPSSFKTLSLFIGNLQTSITLSGRCSSRSLDRMFSQTQQPSRPSENQ